MKLAITMNKPKMDDKEREMVEDEGSVSNKMLRFLVFGNK